MVRARKKTLFGLGIGHKRYAHRSTRTSNGRTNRRTFSTERNDVCKVIGHDRHVEIDVGDKVRLKHCRVLRIIVSTNQTLFLCGNSKEQN